jgi:uncharacterized MAPEG superfamily protein
MTSVPWHFLFIGINVLIIYLPRILVAASIFRGSDSYDNDQPRSQQKSLQGISARAQAAYENSFEVFAPFAAAIFVSHWGFVPPHLITMLALTFTISRLFYLTFYLLDKPTLRTIAWFVGFVIILTLLFLPFLGSLYFCWFHPQMCNPTI